jgi:hypothetical protein
MPSTEVKAQVVLGTSPLDVSLPYVVSASTLIQDQHFSRIQGKVIQTHYGGHQIIPM